MDKRERADDEDDEAATKRRVISKYKAQPVAVAKLYNMQQDITKWPKDLRQFLLETCDGLTALNLFQVSKFFAQFAQNEIVWRSKVQREIPNEFKFCGGELPCFILTTNHPWYAGQHLDGESGWRRFYLHLRHMYFYAVKYAREETSWYDYTRSIREEEGITFQKCYNTVQAYFREYPPNFQMFIERAQGEAPQETRDYCNSAPTVAYLFEQKLVYVPYPESVFRPNRYMDNFTEQRSILLHHGFSKLMMTDMQRFAGIGTHESDEKAWPKLFMFRRRIWHQDLELDRRFETFWDPFFGQKLGLIGDLIRQFQFSPRERLETNYPGAIVFLACLNCGSLPQYHEKGTTSRAFCNASCQKQFYDTGRAVASIDLLQNTKNTACDALILSYGEK